MKCLYCEQLADGNSNYCAQHRAALRNHVMPPKPKEEKYKAGSEIVEYKFDNTSSVTRAYSFNKSGAFPFSIVFSVMAVFVVVVARFIFVDYDWHSIGYYTVQTDPRFWLCFAAAFGLWLIGWILARRN